MQRLKIMMSLFVLTATIAGCSTSSLDHKQTVQAEVIKAVDGDTVKVKWNGDQVSVRLLLVDTPETHHPDEPVQPYGPEAAQFTKSFVEGQTVQLEMGEDKWDKYHRLLAYIYVGGHMLNEQLLKKGLARVAYVYPPNTKYLDRFRHTETKAKNNNRGIWSVNHYVQDDGFHEDVVPASKQPDQASEASQLPNSSADQLNGPDRNCDDFATHADAQTFFTAAGGPEKDPHQLDHDGDGQVCETLP